MSEAECDVNASRASKLHVGLDPRSGHMRKATRDADLKPTKPRAPTTTTNTTPKQGGGFYASWASLPFTNASIQPSSAL